MRWANGRTVAATALATLLAVALIDARAMAADQARSASPVDWTGDWRNQTSDVSIRHVAAGLRIEGEAVSPGDQANTGDIAATIGIPRGNELSFAMGDGDRTLTYARGGRYDCRVRMTRTGHYLDIEDNGSCGGLNVTFTGRYRRW